MQIRDGILKWVRQNTDEHDAAIDIATGVAHALASVLRDATTEMDDRATHAMVTGLCGKVMQHVLQKTGEGSSRERDRAQLRLPHGPYAMKKHGGERES